MSWEEISELCSLRISHGCHVQPLLDLVEFIIEKEYSKRLSGFISMVSFDTLIVSIYSPIERHQETLHITFEPQKDRWHFEYHPQRDKPVEMERHYDKDLGITKFCQFIEWLKW
jgi:hypothetical protein